MKVKDLIEALQKVDPELETIVEGCDCSEKCGGVEVRDGEAWLTRGDSYIRPLPKPRKSLEQIEREHGIV